jgi:Transposase IS116/IS110/IS902 family
MRESPQPQGFSLIFAAAWLGLVPKQISTGDRTILGKISKRGNRCACNLLPRTTVNRTAPRRCGVSKLKQGRAGRLGFKSDTDEVAIAPDQPTLAAGTKIIEGQFKVQRQCGHILSANACTDVCNVCDAARPYACLAREEYQGAFGNFSSFDRPPLERDFPLIKLI